MCACDQVVVCHGVTYNESHMFVSLCNRYLMQEYGKHQSRLAETIYKAIADRLDQGTLDDSRNNSSYLSLSTGFLRVYRYPALVQPNETSWGMDVHTDSSVISILNQDLVGGLQFYRHGHWHHAHPVPNTLIVNLGDMMQVFSSLICYICPIIQAISSKPGLRLP